MGDALLERRLIDCGAGGLAGQRIDFPGLDQTLSDVLVRIEQADGSTFTQLVKPKHSWVLVTESPSAWAVAWQYLELGVTHILLGFDHLLFVLTLLLIVRGWRRLLATVTAFTVAHINNTGAVRNHDGTMTFTFKQDCEVSDLNCLEVPAGRFDLVTRYYLPHEEIITGEWTLPKIALQEE